MKKIKLTRKKKQWYKERPQNNIIKGGVMGYNADISRKMEKRLDNLVSQLTKETERELKKVFAKDTTMTMDADISSGARIILNALYKKFTKIFNEKGLFATKSMVNNTENTVSSNLNQSFKELSGGLTIKTSDISPRTKSLMKASINESTSLIKSISSNYLEKVSGQVYRSITSGQGLKDLIPFLEKIKGVTKRRAKNIALDQTRKTYSNVAENKMKEAGVTHFEWVHSGGGAEPRKEHLAHDGKVFAFDDLPLYNGMPDYPSRQPFCRCSSRPIIKLDEE